MNNKKNSLLISLLLINFTIFGNLINIQKVAPEILLDIRYATNNNFTNKAVYTQAKCYLLEPVAQALANAAKNFALLGYKIKIWDGYRPHAVQFIFWQLVPDSRYAGDPYKGSKHNRGAAVDLTLTDMNGNEIAMGTEFDDFSERAHRDYNNFSQEILDNRKLLESVMEKHGFSGLATEWWHFDHNESLTCPLLNISFEDLEKEQQ